MGRIRGALGAAGVLAVAAGLTGCQPPQPWTSDLVSVDATGTGAGNGRSYDADLSADGTKVVFTSEASDLGPADDPRGAESSIDDRDVYVRDLTTGVTTLVSANGAGTGSGNGASEGGDFSPDGTKVLFTSFANDLGPTDSERPTPQVPGFLDRDVYVRDLTTGTTTLVSTNAAGTDSANSYSEHPQWAGNDKVVFTSLGNDLGPTDSSRDFGGGTLDLFRQGDIYVRDLVRGTTSLVSVNAAGTDSAGDTSGWAVVSPDGTKVAFHSAADDFGPADHDRSLNEFDFVAEQDLYLRDLAAGTTTLVSENAAGTDSADRDTPAYQAVFSPDSTRLAFSSYASDIVAPDTNQNGDAFLRDLATGTNSLVSTNAAGTDSAGGLSEDPTFSPDGTEVVFSSTANDLGPADAGDRIDLYLRSLVTGETELVSVNANGTRGGNQHSVAPVFSPDGTKIAFMSQASDLGARDTNGSRFDVYLRDRTTATTTLVSSTPDGTDSGDRESEDAEITPDGKILFSSVAGDLLPGGAAPDGGVFLATLHGADLGVTLDAAEALGAGGGGGELTYTLEVGNAGPDPADDVTAAVLVPEGTEVASLDGGGATCEIDSAQPRLVTCSLGDLAAEAGAGPTVTIDVEVDPSAPRPLVAFAAVRSPTVDPAYADNTTAAVADG